MTTALFAMTLDPDVLANFVSSGQNFSAAMESVMTRVITSGDINWATVTTPTVIHVMPVNPFAYAKVVTVWTAAVPVVPNAYRKVASLWNRIIPIFPRSK